MWFKKKKEVEEVKEYNYLATITYKSGEEVVFEGCYPSASAFMSKMVDLMELRKAWYGMLADGKTYHMVLSKDVEFIQVNNEPIEYPDVAEEPVSEDELNELGK